MTKEQASPANVSAAPKATKAKVVSPLKRFTTELMALLEANKDKKVSAIIEQINALTVTKAPRASGGNVFLKDAAGATVAIFDYYFKRWMPLVGSKKVDFGAKANTATGFNSMCKEGVSQWTKQQRVAKQAGADLLKQVASGEVKPSQIAEKQAEIETARGAIVETETSKGMGFTTVEELNKYLAKEGVKLAA